MQVLAAEIIEDLQSALEELQAITEDLNLSAGANASLGEDSIQA